MKLKSLYIKEYKNIKEQTFDFSNSTGYIALIGLNGSGKSNLLEAIGLIFNGIFNNKRIPFVYEIQYDYEGRTYLRKPRVSMIDGEKVKESDMVYPSSVIACYSGEDLRLWHMAFEDYYMHYFKRAINNKVITPMLLYISKYCWNIALISLLSSEKAKVKNFLEQNFGITNLEEVEVTFEFAEQDYFKDHQALKWINRIKDECLNEDGKASLKSFLSYDVPLLPNQTKESTIFHYLYLLSQPKKNQEKGNTIDKYITKIRVENKGVSSSFFSEGHKKLILIECITEILGNNESLLLLDEPDAHVHIALKKEILNCIENFEGQTILTTHSPIFANSFKKNNIFYINSGTLFNKEKSEIVESISDRGIDIINGACIISSKIVVVVEGSGDIECISKAIESLKPTNPQYEQFANVGFIPQGSADHTEAFYEDVISKLPQSVEKIIYLFDNDKPGILNANKIKSKPKVSTVLYKPYYTGEFNNAFYIEDYIPTKYYPDRFDRETINLSGEGEVRYYQLKEFLSVATDIKGKVTKIKNETKKRINRMQTEDFVNFKPLLDQIIREIMTQ